MRPLSLRRLLPWLFALILLFGQAVAFAHTLTHLHPHDADQANHPCEVCIAQAQLGSVAPPSLLVLTIPPGARMGRPADAPVRVDLAPRPARARAPPFSVHA